MITSLSSILVFALGHLGCVKKLHVLLLNGILHAPAGFFDSVPAVSLIYIFRYVHHTGSASVHYFLKKQIYGIPTLI